VTLLAVLRARHLPGTLVAIAVVSGAALLAGDRVIELRYGSGAGIPYATLIPAVSGGLVAGASGTGVPELERLAARSLVPYRALALAVGVGWAVLWAVIAQPSLPGSPGDVAAARNVLGFTGLGLLASGVVGARLSWVLPVGVAIAVLSLAGGASPGVLVWPIARDGNAVAAAVALTCFAAGAVLVVLRGTREAAPDPDG
jgi:hypothetical protein